MTTPSSRRTAGLRERPRAVLVAVQLPDVGDAEHESSLRELERLATTLGIEPVGRVTQKRARLANAAVLGEGKLVELARFTGGTGVVPSPGPRGKRRGASTEEDDDTAEAPEGEGPSEDDTTGTVDAADAADAPLPEAERASMVLVDHELSPSQARNLEKATGAEVLDRASVILAIFQRHARTREARLQVEIARLAYDAPRLRESSAGADRQRGGIGGKGAGESSLELDRRRVRDRIAELRRELASIAQEDAVRRARRIERGDTLALVGYTNAGKSTWFRRLTTGDVYVADELFATLDTTVRALQPETRPRLLVSDTVGFLKKLPHDLVASFRSTLDEAREASLLLHVVDASDPAWREQWQVTRDVLDDLGAADRPSLLLLNKIDCVDVETRAALLAEQPEALLVSALDDESLTRVRDRVVAFFEASMVDEELFVPWAQHGVVSQAHESARVLSEEHLERGTQLLVRAPALVVARLRAMLA